MTFDLEKFKAGQPALTRSGKQRWFVHYDPSLRPDYRLLAKDKRGKVWSHHSDGLYTTSRVLHDFDLVAMYEEPPEPRQIDWSKIAGSSVPVEFRYKDGTAGGVSFLREFFHVPNTSFVDSARCTWAGASLETSLWVFNAGGKNPWPEGAMIDAIRRSGKVLSDVPADDLCWELTRALGSCDIIASRCVGLEEGWRY